MDKQKPIIDAKIDAKNDKFIGGILGAAIGDALGMPTEYLSVGERDRFYGGRVVHFEDPMPTHPCSHLKAGQWTDDTQQVVVLLESLLEKQGFDLNDFAQKMGVWGYRCAYEEGYNRYGGGTSMRASLKLHEGEDPNTTGGDSETCGAAMRIAPVGLLYYNDINKLITAATDASRITHNAPSTIDSGVFIAATIGNLVRGYDPVVAAGMAKSLVKSELRKHLDYVISNIDKHPDELAKKIGTSERVYETVPMALSCFLHSPDEFQETVVNAANLCWGDTDSIACIAGAMSGAYNGYNKMPFEYKGKLEDRQRLEGLATELYDISEEIHPVDQSLRIRIDARAMAHNNPLALQAQDGDEVYRDYVEKLGNDIVNYMGQHGMPKVAEQMSKDRVIMLFGQSPDLVAVKFHSPEDKQGSGIVIDGPKENIHGIINYINGVNDISCPDKLMNYVAPEKR